MSEEQRKRLVMTITSPFQIGMHSLTYQLNCYFLNFCHTGQRADLTLHYQLYNDKVLLEQICPESPIKLTARFCGCDTCNELRNNVTRHLNQVVYVREAVDGLLSLKEFKDNGITVLNCLSKADE